MGNQPSGPTQPPVSQSPAQLLPPLPPPCDMECQKQKKLVLLKQAYDSANQETDPVGYEKARIAYFTLLNGPGWLAQEKHRIASQEVEPILKSYREQYNTLKGEQQSQSIFKNLADALTAQEGADKQSNSFLQKQLTIEKDKANTLDRLNQLNTGTPYSNPQMGQYLSWLIDAIITILAIFVGYKVYDKFFGKFSMSSSPDLTSV